MYTASELDSSVYHFKHQWTIEHFSFYMETYEDTTSSVDSGNLIEVQTLFRMSSCKFGTLPPPQTPTTTTTTKQSNIQFELHLYTKSDSTIELYLHILKDDSHCPTVRKVPINCVCTMVCMYNNSEDTTIIKREFSRKLSDGEFWGWRNFARFTREQSKLCQKVTIQCEVFTNGREMSSFLTSTLGITFRQNCVHYKPTSISASAAAATKLPDWSKLFCTSQLSDAIIEVKGHQYLVHKSILAMNSLVFEAMFTNQKTIEAQTNVVRIADFEPNVINSLLRDLYAGSLRSQKEKSYHRSHVMALLLAANKYQIEWLQQEYEKHLCQTLTTCESTLNTLILANQYNIKTLKNCCISYVMQNIHNGIWRFEEFVKLTIDKLTVEFNST